MSSDEGLRWCLSALLQDSLQCPAFIPPHRIQGLHLPLQTPSLDPSFTSAKPSVLLF